MKSLREESFPPTIFGNEKKAKTLVVAWGSNRGVLEEALENCGREDIAGVHFSQVYPVSPLAEKIFSRKKVVVLENNATGQFANLLKIECGVKISGNILKSNGNPFSVEEVTLAIRAL